MRYLCVKRFYHMCNFNNIPLFFEEFSCTFDVNKCLKTVSITFQDYSDVFLLFSYINISLEYKFENKAPNPILVN